jgi:hypothetical protein
MAAHCLAFLFFCTNLIGIVAPLQNRARLSAVKSHRFRWFDQTVGGSTYADQSIGGAPFSYLLEKVAKHLIVEKLFDPLNTRVLDVAVMARNEHEMSPNRRS